MKGEQLVLRVPPGTHARAAALLAFVGREIPAARQSRGLVLRVALLRGLELIELDSREKGAAAGAP